MELKRPENSDQGQNSYYQDQGMNQTSNPYYEQAGAQNQNTYYSQVPNQQNPYGGQPGMNPYGGQPGGSPYGGQPGMNPYGGQPGGDPYGGQQLDAFGNPVYYQNPVGQALGAAFTASAEVINEVLAKSFIFMFCALLLTGITSLLVVASPAAMTYLYGSGSMAPFFICAVVELVLVFACTSVLKKDNPVLSGVLFGAFSIVNGLTFSVVFVAYTLDSIVMVFFTTAIVFAVMAFIGYFTKRDLTRLGNFLFAGLIGIIAGSLINFLIGSSAIDFGITIFGVIIFVLYTAYDVNKIKRMSRMNTGLSTTVLGMYGAMELYLDFINLFLKLLRLLGKRK